MFSNINKTDVFEDYLMTFNMTRNANWSGKAGHKLPTQTRDSDFAKAEKG